MPIRPEMAARYPADWKVRRRFILRRAGHRCEHCGVGNYEAHPVTGSRVVLTIAHLWDMRPEAASLLNLAALCQRCHNRWDRDHRRETRMATRRQRILETGQLALLEE